MLVDGDACGHRPRHPARRGPEAGGTVGRSGSTRPRSSPLTPEHPTIYATGMVDLRAKKMIDLVEGNAAADLRRWCAEPAPGLASATFGWSPPTWPRATGPGSSPHLDHATRVADPFHVVRVGNRCVDKVRRRVQNDTLGHRGRKHDPLYPDPQAPLEGDGTPRRTWPRPTAAGTAPR